MNKNNERYVSKSEVKPLRTQFNNWMNDIRKKLKDQGISFTYMLVGSAKRNLVIRHHNKGFDCDYQIRITANKNNLNAYQIKKAFIEALNPVVLTCGYSYCEDSTSAITIKKKGNELNIINGYDVVIIMQTNYGVNILRNSKINNDKSDYNFVSLPDMSRARENFSKIKGNEMWKMLRDVYYKKKINELSPKATGKKSFQLLNESVNAVLDKF